jgi:SPP1 gp7 family putative phage head morphogenesis protein
MENKMAKVISINNEIYDRAIDHAGMSRFVEESIQTDANRVVRRHESRLRKIFRGKNPFSKKVMVEQVEPEVLRFTKELDSSLTNSMKEVALLETDFQANNLNKSLFKVATVKRTNAKKTLNDLIGTNVQGDKLSKHVKNLGVMELVRIKNTINLGVSTGMSQKDIVTNVIGKTKLTRAQASALVRTSITRTQSLAQVNTFKENKELLKGVRFTAVLDSRTSQICAHHDGTIYDVDDTRFTPPLHWRCRSTLIPVVKSHDELLDSKSPQIKKKALNSMKANGIALLNGASPNKENYGQWLKRQPESTKLRHLEGSQDKVNLFNSGNISLKSFTNSKGKGLSLSALRRIDNAATTIIPTKTTVTSVAARNAAQVGISTPKSVMRNTSRENELREFFKVEAMDNRSTLSLVDYRGTSVAGKKISRRRANNQYDERNLSIDPLTGEQKSTLIYNPDHNVLQERIDFLKSSKTLSLEEKNFIERFALSLENDGLSVNQQSAVVENLRILFERFAKDKKPWANYVAVTRAEMVNSVVNTSRILDRRSRAASNQFKFGANEPSVQILGRWTTFDELADRTLSNQKYINSWADTEGLALAKKAYLEGRSPLSSYFPAVPKFLPELPSARKTILKQIEKLPGGKRLSRKLQGQPNDSLLTEFLANGRESLRKILDLEFFYAKKRSEYKKRMKEASFIAKKQEELSAIMKSIATGKSTDYDTLSINIGKRLYENNKNDFDVFLAKPTLNEFHKMGSKILDGLVDQGKIKIGIRGTTRRGLIDLDSGRTEIGSYKDTISREVNIIDPAMLRLQRASRELVYSRRIGIVNDRDRIYAKAGNKEYIDSRGSNTGESMITRRAGANYDQDLVDKDFANMLNHAMDSEWEVDVDFAPFMDDLVHFRDPRGNVAKYDELNGFRKIILARGEMGTGLMQTVKWHYQRGKSFRNPVQIDGRGRVYTAGYLHPAGGELIRPFINTTKKVAFDDDILFEMMVQMGAMTGEAQSVLTNAGRMRAFQAREKQFREVGELILAKTQRPRRLREFLEHPLVRETDPDHLPKLARFSLEYTRLHKHVNGDFNDKKRLRTFLTQLTNENDASASGAQLIALSTRNKQLALASNVVATDRKNRLYDLVAEATMSDPAFRKLSPLGNDLDFEDLAKAAKGQSMVAFYGAGRATQAGTIADKLAKVLDKKEFTVISKAEINGINKTIDLDIQKAVNANSPAVATSLRTLRAEINEVVNNNAPVGNKLRAMARDSHPDVEEFVDKLTNVRAGIVGPKDFQEIARIMSIHLAEIAPITENFVDFWKDAAQAYILDTQKVDIPWVTMDGKTLYQRYRPKVQHRVDFTDPVTGRRVSNIYEDTVTDGSFLGKSSIIEARSGLGVNGNHMNDATLVRKFHLWGRKNKVPTGTVHDAFFTNIGDSVKAKFAMRDIYADAAESETMKKTLDAMLKEGMSKQTYDRLLKRGIDEGLINPADPLTGKDIRAPLLPGQDWYGVGP